MSAYAFVAKNRLGRIERGTLEAPSQEEAIAILHNRDLVIVSVSEHHAKAVTLGGKRKTYAKVKPQDLVIFAHSTATMIEAGVPLLKSLESVAAQIRSTQLKGALTAMVKDIRGGSTFRDAMAKHKNIFPTFWLAMVETGEAAGKLGLALEEVARHLEKSGAIQRKVVSAMIYPSILIFVSMVAVLVFTLKIIPTFAAMFKGMGAKLPGLTLMVMSFSDLLREYFLLWVALIVGGWFLFKSYIQTPQGRWAFDRWKLTAPILGQVVQGVESQQFASNLGTLLKAGVPILHALEIIVATCQNKIVASVLEQMRTGVREGKPLADPMSQTDIFPSMVVQMVAAGEETGKLPSMLEQVAAFYEEQVNTAVERLTAMLEPLLMVGMGVVIGTLVVSMYLPIFMISQQFK